MANGTADLDDSNTKSRLRHRHRANRRPVTQPTRRQNDKFSRHYDVLPLFCLLYIHVFTPLREICVNYYN